MCAVRVVGQCLAAVNCFRESLRTSQPGGRANGDENLSERACSRHLWLGEIASVFLSAVFIFFFLPTPSHHKTLRGFSLLLLLLLETHR